MNTLYFKKVSIIFITILYLFQISGCKTINSKQKRLNSNEEFLKSLREKRLLNNEEYSLKECIEKALEKNLEIEAKIIEQKISTLDRKATFSNFLPTIDLGFENYNWSKEQLRKVGEGSYISTQENAYNSISLNFGVPILVPSAWFIYSMRKHNEKISELTLELTKQKLVLKITSIFYTILGLERVKENILHRVNLAKKLKNEIDHLYKEGLLTSFKQSEGELYLLTTENELKEIDNTILENKSSLLFEMGFSPSQEINLNKYDNYKTEDFKLDEMIYETLRNHPLLYIQDKMLDIQKDNIKIAIANFLPNIIGYANLNNTTDSFVKYSTYWLSGIQGIWSIFNGFKNIKEYQIAKEKNKLEFLKMEEACLALMLSITKAYIAYQNSCNNLYIANKYLNLIELKFNEIKKQWEEGTKTDSNYFEIITELDTAKTKKIQSEILKQISIANIYNVMGKTLYSKESVKYE